MLTALNQKISSSLFIMNKVKHCIPTSLMKILYYSMVYPYLTYGITLWVQLSNVIYIS